MKEETKQMIKEYNEGEWTSPLGYIRERRRYIDLDIFDEFITYTKKLKSKEKKEKKTKNKISTPVYSRSTLKESLTKSLRGKYKNNVAVFIENICEITEQDKDIFCLTPSEKIDYLFSDYFRDVLIEGVSTNYKVDSKGNVFKLTYSKDGMEIKKLKQTTDLKGRYRVNISLGSRIISKYVHTLVVESFKRKLDSKEYIKHLNGDLSNNHLDNLAIDKKTNIDRNKSI